MNNLFKLSALLLAFLACLAFTSPAAASPDLTLQTWTADFEEGVVDPPFEIHNWPTDMTWILVAQSPAPVHGGNYSLEQGLKAKDYRTGDAGLLFKPPAGAKYEMEAWVYVKRNNPGKTSTIMQFDFPNGKSVGMNIGLMYLGIQTGRGYEYTYWGIGLIPQIWHKVKVVYDQENDTLDLLLNGGYITRNRPAWIGNLTPACLKLYDTGGYADGVSQVQWVDDVNVSVWSRPPSDTDPPITTALPSGMEGRNGWFTSNVYLRLSAADNEGGSGVARTEYSIDGGVTWNTYGSPIYISKEGMTRIDYRSIDNAGNIEAARNITIQIDKTAPVISIASPSVNGLYRAGAVAFSFSAADLSGADLSAALEGPNGSTAVENGQTAALGAGIYTLNITAVDGAGNQASDSLSFVVYDPEAGFVTGGGFINSPSKARFSFVSRYKKGAAVPTGRLEFHFKNAKLKLKSSRYEWLAVAGTRAQCKGEGSIDGAGKFGFLLSVADGRRKGGHGIDRFRIKIWNKASGNVVYDDRPGASDSAEPLTAVRGGSIVIHK